MSEKLYRLFFQLYPSHFRGAYGDEALRLVLERARDEKGFLSGLRLWLDLLVDLAISLPREYTRAPTTPIAVAHPASGDPSFQLLAERSLSPALLFLSGMLAAALLWACVTAVARTRIFPALFRDSNSLQALVQSDLALARSPSEDESGIHNSARYAHSVTIGGYSFCMTARRDIPKNSLQPLFTFHFAPPGASGVAFIDGKIASTFKNEQRLSIRADVFAGVHQFALHLDSPAENTFMSGNDDVEYCQSK
jgi:hypothetical protein